MNLFYNDLTQDQEKYKFTSLEKGQVRQDIFQQDYKQYTGVNEQFKDT